MQRWGVGWDGEGGERKTPRWGWAGRQRAGHGSESPPSMIRAWGAGSRD